jgi:hypothetical protein
VSCSVTLNSTDSGMPWSLHEVEAFAQCLNQLRYRVGIPPLNYYFAEEYCVLAYDPVYSDKPHCLGPVLSDRFCRAASLRFAVGVSRCSVRCCSGFTSCGTSLYSRSSRVKALCFLETSGINYLLRQLYIPDEVDRHTSLLAAIYRH